MCGRIGLRDQATRYIREARDLVKSDLNDVERGDLLAAKIQMLEQIAADAGSRTREQRNWSNQAAKRACCLGRG